ncbi:MAG: metallophosphoesterase family protein [Flavisolibacter sp.]
MRFVAISDTHNLHHPMRLPAGDVLVHAGDITLKGTRDEVMVFLDWFEQQKFKHKIFIAGNHDFIMEQMKESDLKKIIPSNVIYLSDSGINIHGINIWGSPITPWFYNWAFNRHRGPEIQKHWKLIPAGTELLVTHGPVYGFLDMVVDETHVGCQDLLRTVLTIQPKVHLFGHIHESYGNIKRSGIRFINASQVNEHYQLVNQPVVFDL